VRFACVRNATTPTVALSHIRFSLASGNSTNTHNMQKQAAELSTAIGEGAPRILLTFVVFQRALPEDLVEGQAMTNNSALTIFLR